MYRVARFTEIRFRKSSTPRRDIIRVIEFLNGYSGDVRHCAIKRYGNGIIDGRSSRVGRCLLLVRRQKQKNRRRSRSRFAAVLQGL